MFDHVKNNKQEIQNLLEKIGYEIEELHITENRNIYFIGSFNILDSSFGEDFVLNEICDLYISCLRNEKFINKLKEYYSKLSEYSFNLEEYNLCDEYTVPLKFRIVIGLEPEEKIQMVMDSYIGTLCDKSIEYAKLVVEFTQYLIDNLNRMNKE